jgi:hypothetical protein
MAFLVTACSLYATSSPNWSWTDLMEINRIPTLVAFAVGVGTTWFLKGAMQRNKKVAELLKLLILRPTQFGVTTFLFVVDIIRLPLMHIPDFLIKRSYEIGFGTGFYLAFLVFMINVVRSGKKEYAPFE